MKIGVYGDCHLTRNMRALQSIWDITATKSIYNMYNKFDELGVELVVCLGDFFDTPTLSAKNMSLVLPILDEINKKTYPTYILLGNHEAESADSNILEYLRIYDNIHPVTSAVTIEDMCFIPYYESPESIDMKDKIVFTHHDIYGSELAGGKTKAFFGIDPKVFREAKLVMNGHVHLRSSVCDNVLNAGSLLKSQQGEMKLGDYPLYYTLDTKTGIYDTHINEYSMIYLTIDESDTGELMKTGYDQSHLVLKIEYAEEIPEVFIDTAHTSWKKKISTISDNTVEIINTSNFDMKNYLTEYIKKDQEVPETDKDSYVNTGLELLIL